MTGPAVSGPALLLGLADHVVMTADAYAFVSGPRMVQRVHRGAGRRPTSSAAPAPTPRTPGVASLVADDADGALEPVAELLELPAVAHDDEPPPHRPTDDPTDRPTPEAGDLDPARRRPAATTCAT